MVYLHRTELPYLLLVLVFHHLQSFITGLKPPFSANLPNHSLPFLQDCLHGFPGLFTDTSERIRIFTF